MTSVMIYSQKSTPNVRLKEKKQFYSLSELLPEICWAEEAEEIFSYFDASVLKHLKKCVLSYKLSKFSRKIAKAINREIAKVINREIAKAINREIAKAIKREISKVINREIAESINREIAKPIKREIIKAINR